MNKNILKKIIAFATVLILALACLVITSACSHQHTINKWKTIKEPTCASAGVRRGVCVECGEVVEESVPPVADNHVYGTWVIEVAPTYSREGAGKAVRYCRDNPEHKNEVVLPRLTTDGRQYSSYEVTKKATVLEEGEITAVYSSDYGDIAFTVKTDKKEFDPENCTVEDAVLIGSSNRDLIRRGTGQKDMGDYTGGGKVDPVPFSYEYGENYVHTYDSDDNEDLWFSLTSTGEVFGVIRQVGLDGYTVVGKYAKATKSNLEGFDYTITKVGRTFYGAEGLVKYAYEWGSRNDNDDFLEGITTNEAGEKVYFFSFGHYTVPHYFAKIVCQFTLTDNYAIRYVKLTANTYAWYDGETDEDLNQFDVNIDPNGRTTVTLKDDVGKPWYKELVEYNQITKEEEPDEPEHEYTEESFKISSFDLQYSGRYVNETTKMEFTCADNNHPLTIRIKNILPTTSNFKYDPLYIYRITDKGLRVKLGYDNSTLVWYSLSDNNVLKIFSKLAGDVTLLLVTESGYEKTIVITANPANPANLYPSIYEYNDSGYVWKSSSESNIDTTVYVGQSLILTANVADIEKAYTDASFNPSIVDNLQGASVNFIEGSTNVTFVATKSGTYVVKMASTKAPDIYATVTVTVEDPPLISELLTGEYSGKLKKGDVTVSFGNPDVDGKVTATITTSKGIEIIKIYYNTEYGVLICEHFDGRELGVTIEINEAYKLVIANPTGFGSGKERCVIYRVTEEDSSDESTSEDSSSTNDATNNTSSNE